MGLDNYAKATNRIIGVGKCIRLMVNLVYGDKTYTVPFKI
jgi:hypothetical protein